MNGNTGCKLEALKLDEECIEIQAVTQLHPHLEKSRTIIKTRLIFKVKLLEANLDYD